MPQITYTRTVVKAAGIVMVSVLASRILGFAREWTVAYRLGSNAETDAYYAAFTLPDFLNYLIAGGALSITFIPIFSKYLAEKREEEGWKVFSTIITVLGLILVTLVLFGELFAPQIVEIISPGFPPDQKGLVVSLTRLMLPAQIFFYLGGILMAVQYTKGKFLIPALAPIVYNLGIILGGFLLSPYMGIMGFSVGVLVGALVGNFGLQIWGAVRVGLRFKPQINWHHEGFHTFLRLTIPIMLGFSLVYVDDWLQRWFGSYMATASITWLTYAKTLRGIPIALTGQVASVASYPFLARLCAEGKREEMDQMLTGALRAVIFLITPLSVLMWIGSKPLVYLVFLRTRLTLVDIEATAVALALFSIGTFAWATQAILARGFYARKDTWTPMLAGSAVTLLNIPLYAWLAQQYQHLGLALASSIGMITYSVILFVILSRKIASRVTSETVIFFVKVVAMSAALGLAGHTLLQVIHSHLAWNSLKGSLIGLLALGFMAAILVPLLAKLLRIREGKIYFQQVASLWSKEKSGPINEKV